MIIVEPCAGLGNRLLGLASAYSVADQLNRELVVMWKREVGCNVKAADLFEFPVRVIELSENGYSREPLAHFVGNIKKKRWRSKATCFLECGDVEQIKKTEGYEGILRVVNREPVVYMKSFGEICKLDASSFAFLKPCASIMQKGSELFRQIDEHTVGVHIRRTDHTEAIKNSPLSLFLERMKEEIRAEDDAKFFVATDDETVKEELRRQLDGERLLFYETGVIDRNSKAGLEDAFVEMIALSRCRKIAGSYNSTFSLLSSYIGNIPLEVVRKED